MGSIPTAGTKDSETCGASAAASFAAVYQNVASRSAALRICSGREVGVASDHRLGFPRTDLLEFAKRRTRHDVPGRTYVPKVMPAEVIDASPTQRVRPRLRAAPGDGGRPCGRAEPASFVACCIHAGVTAQRVRLNRQRQTRFTPLFSEFVGRRLPVHARRRTLGSVSRLCGSRFKSTNRLGKRTMSDAPSFTVNIVQVAVDDVTEFTCTWRMR